ncbi:MAG: DUF1080 domain-containing protein [Cyclobacteriaceae bacterium]
MQYLLLSCSLLLCITVSAQKIDLQQLKDKKSVNATYTSATYDDEKSLKVLPMDTESEAKIIKLNTLDFQEGIIEVDVVGKRAADAGAQARGFVGIAFRVKDDNSQFECFYIRPTNGRAEDQLRRNHSVQYFSYPDYPWHRLRKETPGKYETYADLEEGEWTKLRIEVSGDKAKLYVNGVEQPTLIVNDLKLGADNSGKIGLWVGPGTEAYFANLEIK